MVKLKQRLKNFNWMDYIIVIIFLAVIITISLPNASALTEGVKLNTPTDLKFTCTLNNAIPSASATFNISISDQQGNYLVNNKQATPQGNGAFNYTTTFTQVADCYKVQMFCTDGTYSFSDEGCYKVTPSGFLDTLAFYILVCLIIVGIIALGYKAQEEWFIVIGGMGLMMLGIYSINSGVAGFRDMFMTWGIGIIEIGIGFVLTIIAGLSKADIDITSEGWGDT